MPNATIAATASGAASGTASPALTIPGSGVVAGDAGLFVVQQTGGQAVTVNPSSGNLWSNDAAHQAWNGTTNRLTVFQRILTADDLGSTVGCLFGATQVHAVALVIIHNTDGEDGVPTTTVKGTASTTDTFGAKTPSVDNDLIIYIDGNSYGTASSTLETHSQPTNYTEDLDQGGVAGSNNKASLAIGHRQLSGGSGVAQTVGNITLGTSARQSAMVLAFKPLLVVNVESWGALTG